MNQGFTNNIERIQWFLRMIPAVLLAVLYGFVVLSQGMTLSKDFSKVLSGDNWPRHLLLSLHAVSVALFFGILAAIMFTRREPIQRERRFIAWILPIAVTLSMSSIGIAGYQDFPLPVMLVATSAVVAGTIMTLYSLRFLGRHFGVVPDVRGLVTNGPYAHVRHPLYAGETVTTIGLFIAAASPVTAVMFAIGIALQYKRARLEEQALTRAFPEYADYASRTPMLIPFAILPKRRFHGNKVAVEG